MNPMGLIHRARHSSVYSGKNAGIAPSYSRLNECFAVIIMLT